jgi:WD40 repeat protein
MNQYATNIENMKITSDDTYSFKYKGKSFHIKLNQEHESFCVDLYEKLNSSKITLSEARNNKLFTNCPSLEKIEQTVKNCLQQGKAKIIENQNKLHFILFDEIPIIKTELEKTYNVIALMMNDILLMNFEFSDKQNRLMGLLNNEIQKINELGKSRNDIIELQTNLESFLNENRLFNEQNERNFEKLQEAVNCLTSHLGDKHHNTDMSIIDNNINNLEWRLKAINGNKLVGKHNNYVYYMIALPNGYIASASKDRSVGIWDINNCTYIRSLDGHAWSVFCLASLPENKLASGSKDKTIKIWDCSKDYKCIYTLYGHSDSIFKLILLTSGTLVSSSFDKQIKVWDDKTHYKCILTLNAHNASVKSLINLQNDYFASGSWDNTIKVWDDTFTCINTVQSYRVECLLLLTKSNIASGSEDKSIKIWECGDNYKSIHCIKKIVGHTDGIYSLSLFDDFIVSGSSDTSIKIWDSKNDYQCINTLNGHSKATLTLILNDDRILSASWDGTIRLWGDNNIKR